MEIHPLSSPRRSRRPHVLTEEDLKTLKCLSVEVEGHFTCESPAKLFMDDGYIQVRMCIPKLYV